MKYLRLTLLTVLMLAITGCHALPDDLAFFFRSGGRSSGGSGGDGTAASEGDTSGGATLIISTLP